jgi:bleomycin hydrolase
MRFITLLLTFGILATGFAQKPQTKDKAIYKEKQAGFYQNTILKGITTYQQQVNKKAAPTYLAVDLEGKSFPTNPDDYTILPHIAPISQGSTGTCWGFSSTSFVESEVARITGKEIALSQMFVVYHEYIEKARAYVQSRGTSNFSEGSEVNATIGLLKKYGTVSKAAYSGLLKGQEIYDHREMVNEMQSYLKTVKQNNFWNEKVVIETIRDILNHFMGEPPAKFNFKNQEYTPLDFLDKVLQFNPDDYYNFMSTTAQTYNQKGELKVPDNWWHNKDYYNVPLDDFVSIFKYALTKGYGVAFCGDVSEPGYDRYSEVGIIPSYDIPRDYINEDSREFRFYNRTTTDDHCMHVIGYLEREDGWWFMIKDSSSAGFDGPHKGYLFLHEDYIRLKILSILVYKYGAKEVLDNIIK